jgi:prepilin-type N-terminal cleavage/methylation domain-containing protein
MKKSGFTLAELSVVLIIIALVAGMTMTSGVTVISAQRYVATKSKMKALEDALMAFRVANDRIPCPSDLSQTQGSATYGTEGSCTAIAGGVFVATNSNGTATAAEGGVPTATLGLPSDFMYDGWGNRFRYAVDTRMASTGAFYLMQVGCVNGAITVYGGPNYPATGNTPLTTGAIYALVSHGANGHGAVTKNATVVNAGSLNADEQTNCHCTSTGAAGTYAPTYVQLDPYTYQAIGQANSNYNFDDMVAYKERWQMQASWEKMGTNCAGGAYSRAITINSSYVSTVNHTNLTNFPVLFSGTYSYLATQANGGNVANANGYDITFTSDAAGLDLLPFERESYNATTGQVVFWVQVPTVSASSNTTIYLWYDDPDIVSDQSNKTGTWDSNYKGVWHLSETSGAHYDSTSNGNNSTYITVTGQGSASGPIAGGDVFNGTSNYIEVGGGVMGSPSSVTLSGWASLNSSPPEQPNMIATLGDDVNLLATYPSFTPPGAIGCYYNGANNWPGTGTGVNPAGTGWHYYTYTIDGVNYIQTMYIDGVQKGQTTNAQAISYNSPYSGTVTVIGAHGCECGTTFHFAGSIDEVRVSKTVRSADWIATEYNNQSSPGTFYTVGSAVTTR